MPDINSKLAIPYPVTFPSLASDFKATEKYQLWLSDVAKFGIHDEKEAKKESKDSKNVKPVGKTTNIVSNDDSSTITLSKISESFELLSNIGKSYGSFELLKSDISSKAPPKEKKEEKEAREIKEKAEQAAFDLEHEELLNSPIVQYYKEIRDFSSNTLEIKLRRLKSKCESECLAIRHQADKLWNRLDSMIGDNIKSENNAIENLSSIIKVFNNYFSLFYLRKILSLEVICLMLLSLKAHQLHLITKLD